MNIVAYFAALFQVDVDLDSQTEESFRNLKFKDGDKDVEKLVDWKPIRHYWLVGPAGDKLHIFVKLPAVGK